MKAHAMVLRVSRVLTCLITLSTSIFAVAQPEDVFAAQLMSTIEPSIHDSVTNLQLSEDGSTLVIYDRTESNLGLEVWDLEESRPKMVVPVELPKSQIYSIALSKTGKYLGVATEISLDIWNLQDQALEASFADTDTFAFFPDERSFVYSTLPDIEAESETIIYDLETDLPTATFDYPVAGNLSISPAGEAIAVTDPLNARLFVVHAGADGNWSVAEFSTSTVPFYPKSAGFYNDEFLVVTIDEPIFLGTYVMNIAIGTMKEFGEPVLFPTGRIFPFGKILIFYDVEDNITIYDPLKQDLIVSLDSSWFVAGRTSDGDQYALLGADNSIDIYQTGLSEPVVRIVDCRCALAMSSDISRVVAWNSRVIYVYDISRVEESIK